MRKVWNPTDVPEGTTGIRFPYFDADGKEVAARFMFSIDGDCCWEPGSRPILYGLNHLKGHEIDVVLGEDEDDVVTCDFHKQPALAVPDHWDEDRDASVFDTIALVYVNDKATALLAELGDSRIRERIRLLDLGRFRTFNAMHVAGEFDKLRRIRNNALTYDGLPVWQDRAAMLAAENAMLRLKVRRSTA